MKKEKILLAHGSGGKLMHKLIRDLLFKKLGNPVLSELSDSAVLRLRGKIAFTTDSFVIDPIEFPGGDIGKLSVCGTVNDLLMQGALPEYLSLGLIIEEGLDYRLLEKIIDSVALAAKKAGVIVATGDLKVVEKGAADKIFINTAGVGRIISNRRLSLDRVRPHDSIIITGTIAEHGLAVLARRQELNLELKIKSDCASLDSLLVPIVKNTSAIKFMRDPTRGGVATTLNEIAQGSGFGVIIEEECMPVSQKVRAAGELLGIDPFYVANEGKAVMVVEKSQAKKVLALLRKNPLGQRAMIIGTVTEEPRGRVVLETVLGTQRVLEMLTGEMLPRIC